MGVNRALSCATFAERFLLRILHILPPINKGLANLKINRLQAVKAGEELISQGKWLSIIPERN